jgi:hypothetical protein
VAVAVTVIAIVLIGGAIVAVVWWRMADKLFPGTAAKTGQDIPRPRPDHKTGATVIKDWSKPADP